MGNLYDVTTAESFQVEADSFDEAYVEVADILDDEESDAEILAIDLAEEDVDEDEEDEDDEDEEDEEEDEDEEYGEEYDEED